MLRVYWQCPRSFRTTHVQGVGLHDRNMYILTTDSFAFINIYDTTPKHCQHGASRIHLPIKCPSLVDHAYSSMIFLGTSLSKFAQEIPFAK